MRSITSNYATLLSSKRIIYVPTCLLLEIMATMYGHIMRIPTSGQLTQDYLGVIVILVLRFTNDLRTTFRAHEEGKVRLFMGDWRAERIRADRMFLSLSERLEEICSRYTGGRRAQLYNLLKYQKAEWARLFRLLDTVTGAGETRERGSTVRYFHCSDTRTWRRTMAQIILAMAELHARELAENEDTHLMLVCYTRLKVLLLRQIEDLQLKTAKKIRFDESKILSVSDQDIRITCPICVRFSDELLKSRRESPYRTGAACQLYGVG